MRTGSRHAPQALPVRGNDVVLPNAAHRVSAQSVTRPDETFERGVRRFEAFSDIVIGFSLAQLGLSLGIPARGADLFDNPAWLISFLWSFALICALWWFHHRVFAIVFAPRTLPVLVNFLWLAVVVLCVYATQVTSRLPLDPVGWRMYFTLFTLAYGLLALQYQIGIPLRSADLSAHTLWTARKQRAFMLLWTAAFALSSVGLYALPWGAPASIAVWSVMAVVSVASTLLGRHFRRQAQLEGL